MQAMLEARPVVVTALLQQNLGYVIRACPAYVPSSLSLSRSELTPLLRSDVMALLLPVVKSFLKPTDIGALSRPSEVLQLLRILPLPVRHHHHLGEKYITPTHIHTHRERERGGHVANQRDRRNRAR
jgi:hypothetical protein